VTIGLIPQRYGPEQLDKQTTCHGKYNTAKTISQTFNRLSCINTIGAADEPESVLLAGLDLPGGGCGGSTPAGKTATPAGEHLQKCSGDRILTPAVNYGDKRSASMQMTIIPVSGSTGKVGACIYINISYGVCMCVCVPLAVSRIDPEH